MSSPLFIICRHGTTEGNEQDTYRGWSEIPLSATGVNDMREAGVFLSKIGLKFAFILSDDLTRSKQSAAILGNILGIQNYQTDKRLRPLNVGDFTGQSKKDYPLDVYMKYRDKRIPGGESLNQFDHRESLLFDDILNVIAKTKQLILLVGHGSTVSFLHNSTNKNEERIGYEGLTYPGGVLAFFKDGVVPLLKKKEIGYSSPIWGDGTALSGFVTETENPQPRVCWHCSWFNRDINGLGGCGNPIVRIDPSLQDRKQLDGTISVEDDSCCNYYTHSPKVSK